MSRETVGLILLPSLILTGIGVTFAQIQDMKTFGITILVFVGICLSSMLALKLLDKKK